MLGNKNMPKFGPLAGVKVLSVTQSTAGPHAVQMLADYGADVIWVENPRIPDVVRRGRARLLEQEHRNQRSLALNVPSKEGQEILLKMVEEVEMVFEVSRGGQWDKWGLTDEVLWEHNPALVIVHFSGYGQGGVDSYVRRASYDPLAQAFSGYVSLNGFADRPGIPAAPYTGDMMSGAYAALGAVAALYGARATGKGESVDIAQYEILMRAQPHLASFMTDGVEYEREGNHNLITAGWGSYTCSDNEEVFIIFVGAGVFKAGLPIIGLEYGSELFPEGTAKLNTDTEAAAVLEEHIESYCKTKTAAEVEAEFLAAGAACSRVMTYPDIAVDPHIKAREILTTWDEIHGHKITGVNVVPKFKNNPGVVWRGAPDHGMDNEEILGELGFSEEEIDKLYETGTVGKVEVAKPAFND